jgi:BirA family transcriptional regulator, biotin operon repressor / biotin---[acetyl-CoA-carboxylase] ligase
MSEALPPNLANALLHASDRLDRWTELHYFGEVDSTNDVALAFASRGAAEGTSILADHQRLGRGRRGQAWFSPAGAGLYLSVVLRPGGDPDALTLVTLAVGVAAAEAVLAAAGLRVELKWPNDLMIGRPWRKVGGILCESMGVGATVEAVVAGIGINLTPAAYPREIADRATSIESELGRPVERAAIVIEVLAELRRLLVRLRAGDRVGVCADWRRWGAAGLGGAPVRWHDHDDERRGRARDIDETGALVVDANGRVERLIAGDVRWEQLSRE